MPHLQRAVRVSQQVDASNVVLAAYSDILEQSATGVLLLDRSGRVSFANRAARAMAQTGDGFRLRGERIEAVNGPFEAPLQRLVAAAAGRMDGVVAARGGVMRLPRKSGKADYAIAAAPLADATWSETGTVAFVLITDPDASSPHAAAAIRQLFGLSAAEVRVAERLMLGETPEQAAASLSIRTSTARWHLASLYRKTGTSRQSQLVRLLISVPRI
jgi:DNA-binding CsgD family transcriptional regulator